MALVSSFSKASREALLEDDQINGSEGGVRVMD